MNQRASHVADGDSKASPRGGSMIQQVLLLVAFAVSSAGLARSQDADQSNESARAAILQIEQQTDKAFIRADWEELNKLWANDLVYVNGKGENLTKAEWLAYLRSGAIKYYEAEHSDVRVHVYHDSAIVTGC